MTVPLEPRSLGDARRGERGVSDDPANDDAALDARWRAHVMRLLAFIAIKTHDPGWCFGEQHVLDLTSVAEEIARNYGAKWRP